MNQCPSCGMLDRRHAATCQTPEAVEYWAHSFRPEYAAKLAGDDPGAGHLLLDYPDVRREARNRHLHRHAADLWATPLTDLREALTDLTRAVLHVVYDHTLGRRHRGRET